MSPAVVDALAASRFFGTKPKIGVLRYDVASQERALNLALKPALARHGLRVAEEAAIGLPGAASGAGYSVAHFQSAVLRFHSNGVTHVLFLGHGMSFFFMNMAESQAYRPQYGLTSLDEAALLLQGVVPTAQLANSRGIGWRPTTDVDDSRDPGGNASVKRCHAMLAASGQVPSGRGQEESSYGFCDGFFTLQAAFMGTTNISRDAIVPAINALGTRYRSALSLATRLTSQRHDGVAAIRRFDYDEGCSCFRYVGAATSA
jgi:hypothetical protein